MKVKNKSTLEEPKNFLNKNFKILIESHRFLKLYKKQSCFLTGSGMGTESGLKPHVQPISNLPGGF